MVPLLSFLLILTSLACQQAIAYNTGTGSAVYMGNTALSPLLHALAYRQIPATLAREGWDGNENARQPVKRQIPKAAPGSLCNSLQTNCASHGHPVHTVSFPYPGSHPERESTNANSAAYIGILLPTQFNVPSLHVLSLSRLLLSALVFLHEPHCRVSSTYL